MSGPSRHAQLRAWRECVTARLDEESRRILSKLVKEMGWSPSRVVRAGIRLIAACRLRRGRSVILGLGRFKSGIADLGSSKKHRKGFGR